MVPLTITPRSLGTTLSSTANTSVSVANQSIASVAQIVRSGNMNVVTTVSSGQINSNSSLNAANNLNNIGNASGPCVLPIAKVLPQQQHQQSMANEGPTPSIVSVSTTASGQSVFIHSRSPSTASVTPVVATNNSTANIHLPGNSQNTVSFISSASGAYYVPSTVHSNSNNSNISATTAVSTALHTITTNTSSVNTNAIPNISTSQIITGTPVTSIAYAPQAGSFAVVPASNRKPGPPHGKYHFLYNYYDRSCYSWKYR